jgi:hypothetical protein
MPRRNQVVPTSPLLGGSLVTDHSPDVAGIGNFTVCRNWRREQSEMKASEGYDYYWPNTTGTFASDPGNQPFPNSASAIVPTSATFYQGIVTLQVGSGHTYIAGEKIRVSGFTEADYNGDFEVSYVSGATVNYAIDTEPTTPATGTGLLVSNEPINLVHQAVRPNGKVAHIVGTKTRLFRFFSFEDSDYFEGTPSDPYFEDAGVPGDEYFSSNQGDWIQIATGLSINGKRWQSVNINGWSVFNNSVDLPLTYRVEDTVAHPIYELREQGIAAVECIEELNGILNAGGVLEIQSDALEEVLRPQLIQSSEGVTASQSGTTVTSTSEFFSSVYVGRYIVWDDGTTPVEITGHTSPKVVTVGASATTPHGTFRLRTKAAQTGCPFSTPVTASVAASSTTVTADTASSFVSGDVGKTLRFVNGFESVIASRTSDTIVELTDAAPVAVTDLPYWLIDTGDDVVEAESGVFTGSDLVGSVLVWDSGEQRIITEYVDSTHVKVNSEYAVASGFISIENPDTYAAFTDYSKTNRIQYRHLWSAVDDPTRFAAVLSGSITAGSRTLVLDGTARSLERGDEITILGAGTLGGNLTTTITGIAGGRVIGLQNPAITTAVGAGVQRSDAIGSIVGQADLQDDSSAIVNMKRLRDKLVIYKDTSIIIASYTGLVESPFSYHIVRVPEGRSLYFRNLLISIDTDSHVFAGRNSFYSFDLTTQMPKLVPELENCRNLFFDEVAISDDDEIFATHCAPTSEVWIAYPGTSGDRALRWSYKYGNVATSSFPVLAAATMDRPEIGNLEGVSENWFVMGMDGGTVCIYGKTDQPMAAWADDEIFYTRSANPYSATKGTYVATITYGLADFGLPYDEKILTQVMPYFGVRSDDVDIAFSIYSSRVPSETPELLDTTSITSPLTSSAVPMHFMGHYFQDSYQVTINEQVARFKGRQFDVRPVSSNSKVRVL